MPPENDPDEITVLLHLIRQGNLEAEGQLIPLVYSELRKLAGGMMSRERPDHTLQATALVNEAFLRMMGHGQDNPVDWQDRNHFFATAARCMRRILVDHARALHARRRFGGLRKISLESALIYTEEQSGELMALDEALDRLAAWDERACKVVEMHFFSGLNFNEIAAVLGVAQRTVRRDWTMARAWLLKELTERLESDTGAMGSP